MAHISGGCECEDGIWARTLLALTLLLLTLLLLKIPVGEATRLRFHPLHVKDADRHWLKLRAHVGKKIEAREDSDEYAEMDEDFYRRYVVNSTGIANWPRPASAHLNEEHYWGKELEAKDKLAMRAAFLAYKEKRTAKLREVLKDVPAGEPIVLMVVNYGQLPLFLNWVCGLREMGLDSVLQQSLVMTPDMKTFEATKDLLPTYFSGPEECGVTLDSAAAGAFGDKIHKMMMLLKLAGLYSLVEELGYDVVQQDVDIVWNVNPLPLFYIPEYAAVDIAMSYDGNHRQPPFFVNGGFLFVRATENGRRLTKDWLYWYSKRPIGAQQPVMVKVMEYHLIVHSLALEVLPATVVPHPGLGGGMFRTPPRNTPDDKDSGLVPMLLHAAWTVNIFGKVEKLWNANRWFFHEACTLYSEGRITLDPHLAQCMSDPLTQCHGGVNMPFKKLQDW
eukprot:jgi/Tetstr1/444958/TSEL_032776.t1